MPMKLNSADTEAALHWIDDQAVALREELLGLSNINSGSFNAAGVDACGARLRELFAPLQAEAETISVAPYRHTDDQGAERERALGHAMRLRKRPDAPLRVFLCGHLDTVFGTEHSFQQACWDGGERLHGPGVADLKGGLLVLWLALSALERSPYRERIGWEVLLNPDEEIGSQGSGPLLKEAASRNHFGLVYEPAYADGGLASERKGSGNFDVIVHGRAAHAGRNPEQGRNAIAAAAALSARLDALNGGREGFTLNLGYVHGGGSLNIVPDTCVVKFNVRTGTAGDESWLMRKLQSLLAEAGGADGYRFELRGGFTRPPKPVSPGIARLQDHLRSCGGDLGIDLRFRPTGGCCDGNNLAAWGLPNVDNLGVVGGEIHSAREWMHLPSLAERAKLSALLLLRLAGGEIAWQ